MAEMQGDTGRKDTQIRLPSHSGHGNKSQAGQANNNDRKPVRLLLQRVLSASVLLSRRNMAHLGARPWSDRSHHDHA
jgi:hypothetical protein